MRRPRPPVRLPVLIPVLTVALALGGLGASTTEARAQDVDGLRVGLTFGGVSFVGVSLEYVWRNRSVDVTLGTSALRDASLSVVGKQYLGPGGLRPYFGAGLWGLVAFPGDGTGAVLVARAPVGFDWRVVRGHHLGAAMNINRALWVRRTDPDDPTPLNRSPVPLPGFYYRWGP